MVKTGRRVCRGARVESTSELISTLHAAHGDCLRPGELVLWIFWISTVKVQKRKAFKTKTKKRPRTFYTSGGCFRFLLLVAVSPGPYTA